MWFYFFKKKVAYECRISDWSSDVCSSDLIDRTLPPRALFGNAIQCLAVEIEPCVVEPAGQHIGMAREERLDCPCLKRRQRGFVEDRKRVAEGKSVSVCLDLIGCRNIKNK